MSPKAAAGFAVDITMAMLLPVLMAHVLTDNALHEIIGVVLFGLFILHHVLNLDWYGAIFSGRWNAARILFSALNVLLSLAMIGTVISSVMVSRLVFSFLGARGGLFARKLHVCTTAWGFLLMAVHLGLHWGMAQGVAKRLAGGAGNNRIQTWALRSMAVLISAYGIIAYHTHDMAARLVMYYGYSFLDPERSRVFYFMDLLAIMGLFTVAGHYGIRWLRKAVRRGHHGVVNP